MLPIRHSFSRAAAQSLRSQPATLRSQLSQRSYATNGPPGQQNSGSQRGLLIAAALGIPAVYYFATKGDSKPGDISGQHHGANQEYKKSGEGNN